MSLLFLDIENVGDELLAVGYAIDDQPVIVVPDTTFIDDLLVDPETICITHTKYDLRWLRLHGVETHCQLRDTQVMAWLVNENTSLSLEDLALRYLGERMDKRLSRAGTQFLRDDGVFVPLRDAPPDQLKAYNRRDVETLRRLYHKLHDRLIDERLWDYFDTVEAPFTETLLDMETRGIPVDLRATEVMAERLRRMRDNIEVQLKQGLPSRFNVNSSQNVAAYLGQKLFHLPDRLPRDEERETDRIIDQLAEGGEEVPGTFITEKEGRLYDHGYWVVRGVGLNKDQPYPSVARPVLLLNPVTAQDPWVQMYLEWKKLDKLLGTYLEKFPKIAVETEQTRRVTAGHEPVQSTAPGAVSTRIYGRFNQTGTVTGRLSSSDPNLQNIPSKGQNGHEIRQLFTGNLICGDFSQLEPRLMAHFSQDPAMLDVFRNAADIYKDVANAVGCTRDTAKVLVLAMGYGAGANKLRDILALSGVSLPLSAVQQYLGTLQSHYSTYFSWREYTIQAARQKGFVETLDGRRRRIEAGVFTWKDKGRPDRQAANAVIQGSAADVVRRVMLHTARMFPKIRLLAQVHDELLWEYDPPVVKGQLQQLAKWVGTVAQRGISVPLVFEPHYGRSWDSAKEGMDEDVEAALAARDSA